MKLSTKLKITCGFLIFIPIILISTAFYGLSSIRVNDIMSAYRTDGIGYDALVNPIQLINKMCKKEFDELNEAAESNPDKLLDESYLSGINNSLKDCNASLLVAVDGTFIYRGRELTDELSAEILSLQYKENVSLGIYLSDYKIMLNGIPFTTTEDGSGVAYVVLDFKDVLPQIKRLCLDIIIAIVLILILTSCICTLWIYKSTVNPIRKLRLATNNIKNGNLDFTMDVDGNNEFAELCKDFDNMRKRLKVNAEEKVKADAESKELISNISHDLKTPITAIKGYVEGIMDGVADTPEKMNKYIKTIYNKACDMDKLIDELAFYNKVDSNRLNYNFKKVNITGYFEDCIDEIGTDLENKSIKLDYINNLGPDTEVVIDPEQFKRVIYNVVNNSIKYMEVDNGKVEIALSEDESTVKIALSDNGKGIDPKDIDHIFDRFYRSDTSRNSAKGGSGLGLSIVKKIISDHGGSVSAESEPGVRTTITIILDKVKEGKVYEENTDC